ncbi:MAG: hypothetical protein P8M25_20080, partial [Paracoccaceae bacterium]|nr:hypothetical protein [Paracoccaceae bacterium]
MFLAALIWSVVFGYRQTKLTENDEIFGDPVRTKGGWYWAVTGLSALMLIWFYFSWGTGRAFFPDAANEMCQVAKLEESISPIKAALPIGSRYYKSTLLVSRNSAQLDVLEQEIPTGAFSLTEQIELKSIINQIRSMIANSSNLTIVNSEADL